MFFFFWLSSNTLLKNLSSLKPDTYVLAPWSQVGQGEPGNQTFLLPSKVGIYSTWLVVDLPLWKICQLGWWHSQYMEKTCSKPPTRWEYTLQFTIGPVRNWQLSQRRGTRSFPWQGFPVMFRPQSYRRQVFPEWYRWCVLHNWPVFNCSWIFLGCYEDILMLRILSINPWQDGWNMLKPLLGNAEKFTIPPCHPMLW